MSARPVASVALLLLGFLGAGCAEEPPSIAERARASFHDAKHRVADEGTQDMASSTTINVPGGTYRLYVRALYDVRGEGSFVLSDPKNNGQKFDSFVAPRTFEGSVWFERVDPDPGRWKFNVNLPHGGVFAFGFYRE